MNREEKIKEINATIEQLQQQIKELETPFIPIKNRWYWIKRQNNNSYQPKNALVN